MPPVTNDDKGDVKDIVQNKEDTLKQSDTPVLDCKECEYNASCKERNIAQKRRAANFERRDDRHGPYNHRRDKRRRTFVKS